MKVQNRVRSPGVNGAGKTSVKADGLDVGRVQANAASGFVIHSLIL